jgi:hypothetical protein
MKTLVIHPFDATTDFLSVIYYGQPWTKIRANVSHSAMKTAIRDHDRIIMLGHGTEEGLIGFGRFVINSTLVYLLRQKETVCIWCNADAFVRKYGLKGFYTGMIISEYEEAIMYSMVNFTSQQIKISNLMFAESMRVSIQNEAKVETALSMYADPTNPIVEFNRQNIFEAV